MIKSRLSGYKPTGWHKCSGSEKFVRGEVCPACNPPEVLAALKAAGIELVAPKGLESEMRKLVDASAALCG